MLHARRLLRLERVARAIIQIPQRVDSEQESDRSCCWLERHPDRVISRHGLGGILASITQRLVLFEIAENVTFRHLADSGDICNSSRHGSLQHFRQPRLRNLNVSRPSRGFVDVDNVDSRQTRAGHRASIGSTMVPSRF